MAAIYDKALKRKDYSGVVKKEREEINVNTPSNEEVNQKDAKGTDCCFMDSNLT